MNAQIIYWNISHFTTSDTLRRSHEPTSRQPYALLPCANVTRPTNCQRWRDVRYPTATLPTNADVAATSRDVALLAGHQPLDY